MDALNSDVREYSRINYSTEVAYKILGEHVNSIGSGYREAITKNISSGGMCMTIQMRLDEGDVMLLDVSCGGKTVNTIGEVMWCKRTADGYDAGLSFMNISGSDSEFLDKLSKTGKVVN